MAEAKNKHRKHVQGLPAVFLGPMERCDEVRCVDREHPVVCQEEPHKQEDAQNHMDIVAVSILSPRVLVVIIIANDNGLGDEGAHVHGVI